MRQKLLKCNLLLDRLVSFILNCSNTEALTGSCCAAGSHHLIFPPFTPTRTLVLHQHSQVAKALAATRHRSHIRCRYSNWQQTPNVSLYQLCNVVYLTPPTDFYIEKQLYSPKNGDLLTLAGVSKAHRGGCA